MLMICTLSAQSAAAHASNLIKSKQLLGILQKCEKNLEDYRSCVNHALKVETKLLDQCNYEQNNKVLKESIKIGASSTTSSILGAIFYIQKASTS